MDSPAPPQAPDPVTTANAQAGANSEAARVTTRLNRANQYTPYGSLTWEQGPSQSRFNQERYDAAMKELGGPTQRSTGKIDPMTGEWGYETVLPQSLDKNDPRFYDTIESDQWSSKVNLDPRVQAVLDAQLRTSQGMAGATDAALGRVNETFAKPAPTPNMELRKQVEDALYQRHASRLDPAFEQQENAMRSQLMNRGIVEGSEAWQTQLDNFGRSKNDAYDQARTSAIGAGGSEMARQYELESSGRNAVLNELSSLRTGQQVNTPQFSQTPSGASVGASPIAQLMQNQYQGQLGAHGAEVATSNANTSAMAGLATSALGLFMF